MGPAFAIPFWVCWLYHPACWAASAASFNILQLTSSIVICQACEQSRARMACIVEWLQLLARAAKYCCYGLFSLYKTEAGSLFRSYGTVLARPDAAQLSIRSRDLAHSIAYTVAQTAYALTIASSGSCSAQLYSNTERRFAGRVDQEAAQDPRCKICGI